MLSAIHDLINHFVILAVSSLIGIYIRGDLLGSVLSKEQHFDTLLIGPMFNWIPLVFFRPNLYVLYSELCLNDSVLCQKSNNCVMRSI